MPDMTALPDPVEWQAFRQQLLGYVGRRVNHPADAEDLVQDILARAAGRLSSLRSGERLVPWLHAISRHALVDFYRAKGRTPELVELEPGTHELDGQPEEGATGRAALVSCVRPMLAVLPEIYREAVLRVDLNEERQVDVARDLGLGISALKSRVQRGRVLLRDAFTDCCALERDATGRVVDFHPKGRTCLIEECARVRLRRGP